MNYHISNGYTTYCAQIPDLTKMVCFIFYIYSLWLRPQTKPEFRPMKVSTNKNQDQLYL